MVGQNCENYVNYFIILFGIIYVTFLIIFLLLIISDCLLLFANISLGNWNPMKTKQNYPFFAKAKNIQEDNQKELVESSGELKPLLEPK
jgi:hypothetical protein